MDAAKHFLELAPYKQQKTLTYIHIYIYYTYDQVSNKKNNNASYAVHVTMFS